MRLDLCQRRRTSNNQSERLYTYGVWSLLIRDETRVGGEKKLCEEYIGVYCKYKIQWGKCRLLVGKLRHNNDLRESFV